MHTHPKKERSAYLLEMRAKTKIDERLIVEATLLNAVQMFALASAARDLQLLFSALDLFQEGISDMEAVGTFDADRAENTIDNIVKAGGDPRVMFSSQSNTCQCERCTVRHNYVKAKTTEGVETDIVRVQLGGALGGALH